MRELVKERRANSKTFLTDTKGKSSLVSVGAPLHFRNARGNWQDIDLRCRPERNQYCIDHAPYTLRVGHDLLGYRFTAGNDAVSAELVEVNNKKVTPRVPEIVDYYQGKRPCQKFVYRSIGFDTDLEIVPRRAGTRALVVLHSENAARKFKWLVDGKKSLLQTVRGWDAQGKPLVLDQEWNNGELVIKWDGEALPKRQIRKSKGAVDRVVYPVKIDPTVTINIAAGGDDWRHTVDSSVYTDRSVIDIFYFTFFGNTVGPVEGAWRFRTVNVGQGATINSANFNISITGFSGGNTGPLSVFARDADNPTGSPDGPANWTKTSAIVTSLLSQTGNKAIGVTNIIQEIVSRSGWSSGNNIDIGAGPPASPLEVFIAAYEHTTAQEAQLYINFATGGGTPEPSFIPRIIGIS